MTAPTATPTVSAEVAQELHDELNRLYADGWTRPALAQVTGLTPAKLWRTDRAPQKGKPAPTPDEVEVYRDVLAKIAAGELEPPARPKAERTNHAAVIAALVARVEELEEQVTRLTA